MVTADDGLSLVSEFARLSDIDHAQARRLLHPRAVSAEAARAVLESPYPDVWDFAARSATDERTLDRLASTGDPSIDTILALTRTTSLSPRQGQFVGGRVAARAAVMRKRAAEQSGTSRKSGQLRGQLDMLIAAGDALVTDAADTGDSLLPLLQYAVSPATTDAWLAERTRAGLNPGCVARLLAWPEYAFGEQIAKTARTAPELLRRSLVGTELIARRRQTVHTALSSVAADAFADGLGPALLKAAADDSLIQYYVQRRMMAALGPESALVKAAEQVMGGWSDDLGSLIDVLLRVRASERAVAAASRGRWSGWVSRPRRSRLAPG
ncbi:MAG: hypothetical protein ABIQ09_18810 [Jatrophihabitantaceae bacterium]